VDRISHKHPAEGIKLRPLKHLTDVARRVFGEKAHAESGIDEIWEGWDYIGKEFRVEVYDGQQLRIEITGPAYRSKTKRAKLVLAAERALLAIENKPKLDWTDWRCQHPDTRSSELIVGKRYAAIDNHSDFASMYIGDEFGARFWKVGPYLGALNAVYYALYSKRLANKSIKEYAKEEIEKEEFRKFITSDSPIAKKMRETWYRMVDGLFSRDVQ